MKSTLFDDSNTESALSNIFMNSKLIRQQLVETMIEAKNTSRLVCGIYETGKVLQSNSEDCALCIIPSRDVDFLLHIHLTLIEAFCLEAGIKVIKVDTLLCLKDILEDSEIAPSDFNCLIIQHYEEGISPILQSLLKFSDTNENIIDLE